MRRVKDPADPRRCKGPSKDGQCMNEAEYGCDCCVVHGGRSRAEEEDKRLYHLNDARTRLRLSQLSEHNPVFALRQVIALAARLTERRFNLIHDDAEFLEGTGDLDALMLVNTRLKKSANRIEHSLSMLVNKPTVFGWGHRIINLVLEELQGIEDYDQISNKLVHDIVHEISAATNSTSLPAALLSSHTLEVLEQPGIFQLTDDYDMQRLGELTTHDNIKSLIDDIVFQVYLIERTWNLATKSEPMLLAQLPVMVKQFKTLDKQINDAHKIEQELGNLLDASTVAQLGHRLAELINESIAHIDHFEEIADRIFLRIPETLEDAPAEPLLLEQTQNEA